MPNSESNVPRLESRMVEGSIVVTVSGVIRNGGIEIREKLLDIGIT